MTRGNPIARKASEIARGVASRLGIRRAARFRRLEMAYVLLLDDEAHNYMSRLQIEILRRCGRNDGLAAPPHITLKLGFKALELTVFEKYLDDLAATTAPVSICLRDFASFDEGIVFLDVEPNAALDELRRRIVRELAGRFGIAPRPLEGELFRFHATLAYGLPKKHFEREVALLSRMRPSFRFEARSIAMLCHTRDHWIVYRRATLG
jgi:2'-5' RNA ligase